MKHRPSIFRRMGRQFRRGVRFLIKNPITLVLPIVAVLAVGWRHYTYAGLELSVPESNSNLLPNGSFDQGAGAAPLWWRVDKSGDATYVTNYGSGYVDGRTLMLNVKQYKSGEVTLTTPRVAVEARKTYLYKGYYKSYMKFAFLARYFYKDGTSKLIYLRDYRDNSGEWSTVSDAFDSGTTITAVQYVYKITSMGLLEVNGVYLEPKQQVYIAPPAKAANVIPNGSLAPACNADMPDKWQPYRSGSNTAAFAYGHEGGRPELEASLRNYKSGEVKWEFAPIPVKAHDLYHFGVTYKSDVPVQVVSEYVMQDGRREFVQLAVLAPASEWTTASYPLEVPPGASTMFTSVVLKANGTLTTRDYTLLAETKPGAPHWSRPLVSIVFDDGWQSAYDSALPLLDRYGLKSTFYINPSSIETQNFMNAGELKTLAAAGHEVAAHGYAHNDLTALNDEALDYQLHEGRDYLRKAGFAVTDFATPYGNSDAEVQWYARHYFKTMRGTETGVNTRQNFNPYNLKILYVDANTDKDDVAAKLREAQQYDGWLILVYHQLGGADASVAKTLKVEDTTVSEAAFADQMSMVQKSGITVLPVVSAFAEVQPQ